ncbi:hypothetical protein ACJZQ5_000298 [Enterococcus hirae]|uniref:Uncharacterized protein n=2 Tax=Enterococcus hirae TaxID=1354 RepID=I6SUZ2_ENTHA|nr:hypothetical protein [Enterococcus hirae]AFM69167.1 hypothetical protein EHR_00865 [Enterococcus hirae ATCC 9790]EOH68619.1 hypothetical protein UAE_02296 [Enterococcus hirae ATCC 9790]EOU05702.1 hypothetical protein I584_01601 [Enterococcus hirae ATCC 9790]MBA5281024.1 hypothetical protein [Enterococcus hirae]OJG47898.1 hypothetical protein RV05_GL001971 [Enterococcus hirae]
MLKKITSKNGSVFLFLEIPHTQRNNLGIASGESILLSIYENDSFYFTTDIPLIKYESIVFTEEPTDLEKEFFYFAKEKKEIKYKHSLVKQFEIEKYIHYLPKVKYTQKNINNEIQIIGEIKYQNNIHPKEVPEILLNNEVIPLRDEKYFEYKLDANNNMEKLDFKLNLPKQIITRSYKIKK